MLALAQRTADEHKSRAKAEADAMLADARAKVAELDGITVRFADPADPAQLAGAIGTYVADAQQRALIRFQIVFQPFDDLKIKVVGGFI